MSDQKTAHKAQETAFHSLYKYQKRKTGQLLRLVTLSATVLLVLSAGLVLLWYVNSSWIALIFAVLLGAISIILFGVRYFLGEKVDLINKVTSSALNIYDITQQTGNVVDMQEPQNNASTPAQEISPPKG